WKGKGIKEVGKFKYLGYTLQRNGGGAGRACEGKGGESGGNVGIGVEDWEEEIWKGLKEKDLGRTPGYMVREEIQREKLRASAGKRVWAFEERLRGGGSSLLAQLCWEEMQEKREW
ncbi:hypothetical protein ALC57_09751, partial [Trachymyrmex cornetzi]